MEMGGAASIGQLESYADYGHPSPTAGSKTGECERH